MDKFVRRGLSLEYEVKGEGIPFVFLHGMGGSVNQIYSTYEPIEGVKLIALNQQGHGGSDADWESFGFEALGDDIIGLLDYLQIHKACFAGISMGAAVALNIAVRYPEKVEKLMLIRNAWTDSPMSGKVQQAYYDLGMCLKEGGIEAFYGTEGWKIVSESSAYTRNAFTAPFTDASCLKYWQKYLILPGKVPIFSAKELKGLTMPVTVLANKNDLCHPFAYGEWMHEHIPGSDFVEIPDKDRDSAGHKRMINEAFHKMFSMGR